jgi:peptide/nickel transport system substrate-binding protein
MQNKTKFSLILGLLLACSMIISACQPAATEAPQAGEVPAATEAPQAGEAPAATEAPQATEAPAVEQVLRIIHPAFDQNWSPMLGGGHVSRLYSLWWAAPMYFDAAGEIHPMVFSEWSNNADFTKWTFKIDPKAVFSDGSPITAEDVIGTWNLSAHPATGHARVDLFLSGVEGFAAVSKGEAAGMTGLVATNAQTVDVTLGAADPIFYQKLATNLIAPVKISQAMGEDGEQKLEWWRPENGVVVSGPFMPESMDLDRGIITFVRNPKWFGPAPKLDKIIVTSVEDSQTAITMLEAGEADLHTYIETPTLVTDLGLDFVAGPDMPKAQHFWLNANAEPTNDINVRKALIMAINGADLIKASHPDGPDKLATQIPNAVPGADDPQYLPFPYDPEGAKAALAASSYGGPEKLPKLMMVGISYPAAEAAAQYIAEQWRQVLGIQTIDMKPQFDDYSGPDKANLQIYRDDVGTRVPDIVSYLQGSVYSTCGNAVNKMGGYKNPEVDRLLDEASIKGVDDPDRIKLAQEANRIFREDWAFIPWDVTPTSAFAMPWVKNAGRNIDWQIVEPWSVYIEK